MLIPVTQNLWLDPKAVTSVEHVTVDRHGKSVDYVELHADGRFWALSEVDLHDIVAKINSPAEAK